MKDRLSAIVIALFVIVFLTHSANGDSLMLAAKLDEWTISERKILELRARVII